jgi:hypothetical protein
VITVRPVAEADVLAFEVVLHDAVSETRHHVTMARKMWERLTGGEQAPEQAVEAAFRFLLDREPKESVLQRFDVTVISSYFPEFERELPRYLKRAAPKEP